MLRKYYVADKIVLGENKLPVLHGSILVSVWFWESPAIAYLKTRDDAIGAPVNFRRVK